MVLNSILGNTVVLYGKTLLPLWSLLVCMRISLGVVLLKNVFRVCTDCSRYNKKRKSFIKFIGCFAVNEGMSRRAVHKAMFESVALVGASILQIYLLQRLFERKLGISRV